MNKNFNNNNVPSRSEVAQKLIEYVKEEVKKEQESIKL